MDNAQPQPQKTISGDAVIRYLETQRNLALTQLALKSAEADALAEALDELSKRNAANEAEIARLSGDSLLP